MKTIRSANDMPVIGSAQWAVLEFSTIFIPGDERSRTNPGHGYPDSTESVSKLHTFESEADLITWLERNAERSRYIVLRAERMSVKTRTVVDIGSGK